MCLLCSQRGWVYQCYQHGHPLCLQPGSCLLPLLLAALSLASRFQKHQCMHGSLPGVREQEWLLIQTIAVISNCFCITSSCLLFWMCIILFPKVVWFTECTNQNAFSFCMTTELKWKGIKRLFWLTCCLYSWLHLLSHLNIAKAVIKS